MNAVITRNGVVREMAVEGRLIAESGSNAKYILQIAQSGNSDKFQMR
jgi:hypothetical protein